VTRARTEQAIQPPCEADPVRWQCDDARAKLVCETRCPMRLECANIALDHVERCLHPLGIWGGVFIPDDNRTSDGAPVHRPSKARARRRAIAELRCLTGRAMPDFLVRDRKPHVVA
jgi:hypothetical protein